jgi:hypothetical protein
MIIYQHIGKMAEDTITKRCGGEAAITLYCSWFCPYAQRAWIALEAKVCASCPGRLSSQIYG